MTDKALEAAPDAALVAKAMACSEWPKWLFDLTDLTNRAADEADMSTEQAVAFAVLSYLSALPGEAEVVMEQIAHKEQIGIWANELTSALSLSDFLREDWSFDDSVDLENEVAAQLLDIIRSAITHPGLNLVDALQAMQARAEKAERERDEMTTKLTATARVALSIDGEALDLSARAEAAEARVKELEEALEPFAAFTEKRDDNPDMPDSFPIVSYALDLRGDIIRVTLGDFRRARTALKGGSNG